MKKITLILTFLVIGSLCFANPDNTMSVPNSLTDGTTAYGSDVIGNFNEVTSKYNSHSHGDFNSSTSTTFTIGNDTDVNHDYIINNGDANNPMLRYNASTNRWTFTNNGTTFNNMLINTTDLGFANIAWVKYDGTDGSISDSYNVTSVTNTDVGDETINWSITFGNANYLVVTGVGGVTVQICRTSTQTATTMRILTYTTAGAAIDPIPAYVLALGD